MVAAQNPKTNRTMEAEVEGFGSADCGSVARNAGGCTFPWATG
jgi:hypothetical protein